MGLKLANPEMQYLLKFKGFTGEKESLVCPESGQSYAYIATKRNEQFSRVIRGLLC